jgi:hypothetical protein
MLKQVVYIVTSLLPKVTEGGKGKLSLCLISSALFQEDICGSGGIAPSFLTSALDGDESSASPPLPRYPPPGKERPIGGWVGTRVDLDAVEKRKILRLRKSNPGCPAHSPSVYRLSYPVSYRRRENNKKEKMEETGKSSIRMRQKKREHSCSRCAFIKCRSEIF